MVDIRWWRLLGEIQGAYSREDLSALRPRVTPEMLSSFAEELAANNSRGVVNRISAVKLLQGDLAEAWREGSVDYATVAMRFGLIDRTLDRASGRLVWRAPLHDEKLAGLPVPANETFNRRVPVPVLVDQTLYIGSTDHGLYAVDASTGKTLWRRVLCPILRRSALRDRSGM